MHYCFLTISSLENAGLMRARELGKALIERGVEVSYIVDDIPANRGFHGLHPAARVEWIASPRRIGQIARRRGALRGLAPDYVEVLNPHPKTLLPLRGFDGAVVAMWDEPELLKPHGYLRRTLHRWMALWLSRRARVQLAATRLLKEELERRFGRPVAYMPHAAYLPPQPDTVSPYSQPTAVYMGNFYPLWDHDVIIDAARLMAQRGTKPPIVIMGQGPDEEKWKAMAQRAGLDNVRFLGFVTGVELWRHLRHAHVLLFPIRHTLTNLTRCPSKTFAYAQARRPIITSRVGEVGELLADKAHYVDCTPAAFADAIEGLMANPALADVDYRIEKHSWGERAGLLLELIRAGGAGDAGGA